MAARHITDRNVLLALATGGLPPAAFDALSSASLETKANVKAARLRPCANGPLVMPEGLTAEFATRCMAWSPNGALVAGAFESFGTVEACVVLWRAGDGRIVRRLPSPSPAMETGPSSLAFSPDGNTLFAAIESDVFVWDVRTGVRMSHTSFAGRVTCLHAEAGGNFKIFLDTEGLNEESYGEIRTKAGLVVHHLERAPFSTLSPLSGSFSRDGRLLLLLLGVNDEEDEEEEADLHALQVWDVASGNDIFILNFDDMPYSASFSPDGRHLVAYNRANAGLMVVNMEEMARNSDGNALSTEMYNPSDPSIGIKCEYVLDLTVAALAWSHAGDLLYCVCAGETHYHDNRLHVRRFSDGQLLRELVLEEYRVGGGVRALSASPDGRALLISGSRGLELRDLTPAGPPPPPLETLETLPFESDSHGQVLACALSADGSAIAVASNGAVKLWRLAGPTWTPVHLYACDDGLLTAVQFSRDGRRLLATCKDAVRVWDTRAPFGLLEGDPAKWTGWKPSAVSPLPLEDGSFKVLVTRYRLQVPRHAGQEEVNALEGEVRDADGRLLHRAFDEELAIQLHSASFSGDGKKLMVCLKYVNVDILNVWDVGSATTGRRPLIIYTFAAQGIVGSTLSFSPDGHRIVAFNGSLFVVDLRALPRAVALDDSVFDPHSAVVSYKCAFVVLGDDEDDDGDDNLAEDEMGHLLAGCCWSPKSTFLCCLVTTHDIQLGSSVDGRLHRTVPMPGCDEVAEGAPPLVPVAVTPDGHRLLLRGVKNAYLLSLRA